MNLYTCKDSQIRELDPNEVFRMNIAIALIGKPKLLILDISNQMLDKQTKNKLY